MGIALVAFGKIEPDPWRDRVGFSQEVEEASGRILAANDEPTIVNILGTWLQRYQPCLFGRIAAKHNLIHYCLLSEEDLSSEDRLRTKIQAARTAWTAKAYAGKASGFIIHLRSARLALAKPDAHVCALAKRIMSLYLLREDIDLNTVYLDEIFLEKPGDSRTTWRWDVGANYFSAHGDGRWWQDHRIPGGIAFSMNSVGHMVKATRVAAKMRELDEHLDTPREDWEETPVESLPEALKRAMQTISLASGAPSGKATYLLPLSPDAATTLPRCPIELPGALRSKNHCTYEGYYHTDYTLPSEYFQQDVERPNSITPHRLDFTYLFDNAVDNPAFSAMGEGRRIRVPSEAESVDKGLVDSMSKRPRAHEDSAMVNDCPRLVQALRADGLIK
jgi:hypothetical protein